MQVLQRRLRRLTEDLRREVAAEVDGLASLVSRPYAVGNLY